MFCFAFTKAQMYLGGIASDWFPFFFLCHSQLCAICLWYRHFSFTYLLGTFHA